MDKFEFLYEVKAYLDREGYDTDVRSDYSGRGMYGATTPAIVTDASFATVAKYGQRVVEEFDCEDHTPDRSDNMGLSMIYY